MNKVNEKGTSAFFYRGSPRFFQEVIIGLFQGPGTLDSDGDANLMQVVLGGHNEGIEPTVVAHQQLHVFHATVVDQGLAFCRSWSQWLFYQEMDPLGGQFETHGHMSVVWSGDDGGLWVVDAHCVAVQEHIV